MGQIDGLAQPMGKLDGRAQPMGKLDGLASKKPGAQARRPRSGLLRGRVSGRVWRPAGGLGGRRPPRIFLIPRIKINRFPLSG